MLRTFFLSVALLALGSLGCSTEPVITAQNDKTGVFTVCGSRQATKDELTGRAVKACTAAAPTVLRCTSDVKYATVGIEGEVTVSGNCCDYECPTAGGAMPAPPAK
jgi:hypothetical protein